MPDHQYTAGSKAVLGRSPADAARDGAQTAVKVLAHRGSSHDFPEHTLEAYVDAIEAGADGLECDVRLSADGHLICVHDPDVKRITGSGGRVSTMTLAQLRGLDWPGASDGPLLLQDLFELVAECGRDIEIAVETKHPNRFGGAVEEAVCDLIDTFGWLIPENVESSEAPGPVRVMSFSAAALRRVRRRTTDIPLVYLLDKPQTVATRSSLPGRAVECGVSIDLIRSEPAWVAAIRAAGHGLAVWTVDTPEDFEASLQAGAQRLITNRPRLALAHRAENPASYG